MPVIARPGSDEHVAYFSRYIDRSGDDAFAALTTQIGDTTRRLTGLTEAQAAHRYAPDKWSVKQVILHLADTERVFAYRALRFARADMTDLPGYDENAWAPESGADDRPFASLLSEFALVRAATLALFSGMSDEALMRRGRANGNPLSVRAVAHILAGHEVHHMALLRERYGVG